MEYTKEQLGEKLNVVLKDNLTEEDISDVLSWKKWRDNLCKWKNLQVAAGYVCL